MKQYLIRFSAVAAAIIAIVLIPQISFTEEPQNTEAIQTLSEALSCMNAQKNYNVSIVIEDKEKGETNPNDFTTNGIIINPDFSYFKLKETGQQYYRKGDKVAALHPSKDQWELVSEDDKKQLLIAENISSTLEKLGKNLIEAGISHETTGNIITLKPTGAILKELVPQTDINWENSSAVITVTTGPDKLISQISVSSQYELKKYAVSTEWNVFDNPDDPPVPDQPVPQLRECVINMVISNFNQKNLNLSIPEEVKKLLDID